MKQKYVVTTPEAIDEWVNGDGPPTGFPGTLDEGTYFVIKSSDLFGAPALFGYAHLLQTALELDNRTQFFEPEQRQSIDELVEHVHQLAEKWQMRGDASLPD